MADGREGRLQRHLPRLHSYARSIASNDDLASDLTQEAALRALGAATAPKDERAYKAWLFAIVRNLSIDLFRRRRHEAPEAAPVESRTDIWGADDRFIAAITVRQAMATLPPEARDIVSLVDIAGFSYAEAAGILGIPVGTVMSRLSRARRLLLDAISSSPVKPMQRRHGH